MRARLLSALLLACGPSESEEAEEERERSASGWEAHEWGLLGYEALAERNTAIAAASPIVETAGLTSEGGGVGYAPVIYVQLGDARELRFEAAVTVPATAILETWPLSPNARWQVRAHSGACEFRYPDRSQPPCDSVRDGFCEAMNAHHYEASDGACLEVNGQSYDHLLYRAEVARDALPFDVVRQGEGFAVRSKANAPAGRLFRIRRSFALRTVQAVTFDAPPAGQSIALPEPERTTDATATLRTMLDELARAGLTEPEANAFRAAWSDAIVPEERTPRFPAISRMRLAPDVRPGGDAVYYWLPRESADAILPLSFTPAPRQVRRALLVRISLDPPRGPIERSDARPNIAGARGRGIPGDVVRRVVQRHLNEIRFCIQNLGVPARTRLTLHADLLPTGSIEAYSELARSEPENEAFAECALDALRRWEFPPPADGEASIDIDFSVAD